MKRIHITLPRQVTVSVTAGLLCISALAGCRTSADEPGASASGSTATSETTSTQAPQADGAGGKNATSASADSKAAGGGSSQGAAGGDSAKSGGSAGNVNQANADLQAPSTGNKRIGNYDVPKTNVAWVATDGKDSNDGTESKPFATFQKALNTVKDGGTVVAKAGTYRPDPIDVTKKNITIQSAPGATVWIKGSEVVDKAKWKKQGSVWAATGDFHNFCTVCTVNQDPKQEGMAAYPEQAFINGKALRQVASKAEVKEGTFYVEDKTPTTLKDPKNNGKGFNVGKQDAITYYVGSDPTNATAEVSRNARAITVSAEGFNLKGINVAQYSPVQSWKLQNDPVFKDKAGAVAVFIAGSKSTVVDSTFTQVSSGGALGFSDSHGSRAANNRFVDNGGGAAGANRSDDVVYEGNYFSNNNTAKFRIHDCFAYCTIADIKVTHTNRTVFRGNVVDYSAAPREASKASERTTTFPAFWCDEGCIDAKTVNNFFTNVGTAVFYEVSSGGVIASNVVEGSNTGVSIGGTDKVKVYNNTISRTYRPIYVYEDARYDGCNSREKNSEKCVFPEEWSTKHRLSWNTTGVEVYNNILSSRASNGPKDATNVPLAMPVYLDGAKNTNGKEVYSNQMFAGFDYNVYYRSNQSNEPIVMNWDLPSKDPQKDGPMDVKFAKAADISKDSNAGNAVKGIETHALDTFGSRAQNPYFVREANSNSAYNQSNYSLKEGSKARGSGKPLPEDVAKAIDPSGKTVAAGKAVDRGALVNVKMNAAKK